ncbi:MAG TPA: S8 family serine peptidase [Thermoanaerobaculia bacterium]|nr:S8 family serine peptidase [Thermoanaerobaculia bacterium]
MARKSVVAYYMHESERTAAEALLKSSESTDSFAVGEIEESDIEKLSAAGVIVQDAAEPPADDESEPSAAPRAATGAFSFSVAPGGTGAAAALDTAVPAEVDWYVVRLRGPLLEGHHARLTALGVDLVRAQSHDAYQARLSSQQVADVTKLPFVAGVRWLSPTQSAPLVATRSTPPGAAPEGAPALGMVGVAAEPLPFDVSLRDPADRPAVERWLAGREVTVLGTSARKIRISVTPDDPVLGDLQVLPEVEVIVQYVEPTIFNDHARRLLGIDGPAPAPGGPPAPPVLSQDGSGQIVAVADTGLDDQHRDFAGRIVKLVARGRPGVTSDPHGHGTHVAGSVLGDGTESNGQIKGAAPKARLFFQSLLDAKGGLGGLPVDLNDLFQEAYDAGARIHNDSWGADLGSTYTLNSEEVDEFIHDHPDMLVVIAAGNSGKAAAPRKSAVGFVDWLSIGSPASCKNALTVGASRSDRSDGALSSKTWGQVWSRDFPDDPIAAEKVSGDPQGLAAFSSRGPTDDRRIKPDLVAPGTDIASARSSLAPDGNYWGPHPASPKYAFDGGTSMASPLTAGCAALVRQYYVDTRQVEPSAALLKATLIGSTTWLTGGDATAPSPGTPNYHQGHGRIDMQKAIPNPAQPRLALQFVDTWKTPGQALGRTGERRRYQFVLPANVAELRICLAYTDAPARGLQNNVSLMVNHLPSGMKWQGNEHLADALRLPDPDNNVEVVRLPNPAAGTYLIQVFAPNLLKPPQDFALVVAGDGVPALNQI